MKILVTGGSGFLGRHLIKALVETGHDVLNLDLKRSTDFPTIQVDVRDHKKVEQCLDGVEIVFHLASLIEAGESVESPQKYVDNNISGTVSVLEAMRRAGVKNFAFSSSAAIYGEPLSIPIREDDRTIPINHYGVTKLAMEGLLASYVQSFGFTGVALRYFNLYGPEEHHQPETHAIPRFIKQITLGQEVTVWGDGGHQRDYIYIDDIVDAHLKSLKLILTQPNQYHYCNLSTQEPASVMQVIHLLETIIGKPAQIKHYPDRHGDPRVLTADASKSKQLLDWQAKTSLKAGLQRTVKYFQQYWQTK